MDWLAAAVRAANARGLRSIVRPPATSEAIQAVERFLGRLPQDLAQLYAVTDGGHFALDQDGDEMDSGLHVFDISELAGRTEAYRDAFDLPALIFFGRTPGPGNSVLAMDKRGRVLEVQLYHRTTLAPSLAAFMRKVLESDHAVFWLTYGDASE